jgi:hypothetical protein
MARKGIRGGRKRRGKERECITTHQVLEVGKCCSLASLRTMLKGSTPDGPA